MRQKTQRADRRHYQYGSLQAYLHEIGQIPLLTYEQECELAHKYAHGDTEARAALIRANLRLVVNIARQFTGFGLDLEDLIEEGNIGLMRAVERFDPQTGTRFSTYASYWIKQVIKLAIKKTGRTIRLPVYLINLLFSWQQAQAGLRNELGYEPTEDEVAARLALCARTKTTVRLALAINVVEGNSEAAPECGEYFDTFPEDRLGPEEELAAAEIAERLPQALAELASKDARSAELLIRRFGLNGKKPETFKEIGSIFRVTHKTIRRLEKAALQALANVLCPELS